MDGIDITPIDQYLDVLWDNGATDLLITGGSQPRVRVDGDLVEIENTPHLRQRRRDGLIVQTIGSELADEVREKKEVDFSFAWRDNGRFRGNVYHRQGELAMSLRVIPYHIPSFEELGLPSGITHFAGLPQGLVLVTGPTGSGKSTTLASIIDHINDNRACHILTIEDPIEYVHSHKRVRGRPARGRHRHRSRSSTRCRAALREDPDVILVGEMRDLETIQFALTIAETGHLVFATLHTNDAAQAIDRISDVFPADRQEQIRVQLAACLAGVVSQRLVQKVDVGMTAAFEVLIANNAMRNLIREGKTHQIRNVVSTGIKDGMKTLESSLSELVAAGLITYDEALAHSLFPKEIRQPHEHAAWVQRQQALAS